MKCVCEQAEHIARQLYPRLICVLLEACNLYAPQGVDLGEGGSLLINWCDTVKSDWPWLDRDCECSTCLQKLLAKLTDRQGGLYKNLDSY